MLVDHKPEQISIAIKKMSVNISALKREINTLDCLIAEACKKDYDKPYSILKALGLSMLLFFSHKHK